jgi:acetate kinase
MRILAVNAGSSSLKFQLVEATGTGERRIARGVVERIGERAAARLETEGPPTRQEPVAAVNHDGAVAVMLRWLRELHMPAPDAVGHRIVHGGPHFVAPAVIDESVVRELTTLESLAPLHNAPGVAAIRACRRYLGTAVPMVAVFDTGFHATLPEVARHYAIPRALADKHEIRRYGFHGISCAYVLTRYAELTGRAASDVHAIALHLGNGCSVTAIAFGCSVDTSMGLTPLEGLVMGTRSGDVDPGIIGVLAEREGVDVGEVERWLNERSGLLGLSEISRDMRDLLAREAEDPRARLAVDLFCYRARKYVGAYLAVLGRVDALLFTGGIGEHAAVVRARICAGLERLGIALDVEANGAARPDARIAARDATIDAWVIATDEEGMIARDTRRRLEA